MARPSAEGSRERADRSRPAAGFARHGRRERGDELLVEGEEEFEALALGGEGLRPIAAVDGPVEGVVGK